MRTIVVYGNCQARVIACALESALGQEGYVVRFQPSHPLAQKGPPAPTGADLAACALLMEQVDETPFPGLDALPPDCPIVRFPSLDTNLLWPFSAVNPYDLPHPETLEGRYPYGDRILQRCIENDWSLERTVDYYVNHYGGYRLDLGRMTELERARRLARDRRSDVTVTDALEDLVSAQLFLNRNHPRPEVLRVLFARLAAACAIHVAAFAGPAIADLARTGFDVALSWKRVPIHPGVAADLGLTWYAPDGWEAYVRDFVAFTISNRAQQRVRGTASADDAFAWRPPLEGPVRIVGPALGIYPDGFAAPLLRFELEAAGPVESLTVEAYYPPQHGRAATVVCMLGASKAEAMIEPGRRFTLTLSERLAPGERARFALTCSQTLNMVERGENEDGRDLGVLILAMRTT